MATDYDQEVFQEAFVKLLLPVVESFDGSISKVIESQKYLEGQIDSLSEEISHFKEVDQEPPFQMYTNKLVNSRKRLGNISSLMNTIQERLRRMGQMVEQCERKERENIEKQLFSQDEKLAQMRQSIESMTLEKEEGTPEATPAEEKE
eukprot:GCRY01003348.1.p1 GENE.GCRY01003348.1~~GCRY01003348.1.p1  ORF type:complete len:148 (+),score=40.81 GCRY01003348.1:184-627(+)